MIYGEFNPVIAEDLELHPAHYPWSHNGRLQSLDHARSVCNPNANPPPLAMPDPPTNKQQ